MNPLHVIGLDLSLVSTGVAGNGWADRIRPGTLRDVERLHYIRHAVLEHISPRDDLVVIEGPSYGSTGRGQHERGGLWWLIRYALSRRDLPVAVAAPGQLKKYATGRGGADKDEVLAAAIRRFPNVNITSNDEADAYWLCAMGHDLLGHPLVDMPKVNREALAKVAMPVTAVSA
jgi:crossover junction endodeoxyribonuclease RuvC